MTYPLIFRHSVTDEKIFIDNGTGTESMFPYSWWITAEPAYVYPSDATYLQYIKDGVSGQSYYVDETGQVALPADPWSEGDGYIANQSVYDAAYALFLATPTTLSDAKYIQYNAVRYQYYLYTTGKVSYDGHYYYTDNVTADMLFNECYLFTGLAAVPVGYGITDDTGTIITLDLADLQAIVALTQMLYYLCRMNTEAHVYAISILTTIEDVMAYDVTTGWPTIPYS